MAQFFPLKLKLHQNVIFNIQKSFLLFLLAVIQLTESSEIP